MIDINIGDLIKLNISFMDYHDYERINSQLWLVVMVMRHTICSYKLFNFNDRKYHWFMLEDNEIKVVSKNEI